ncbi:DNA-directed RNA polymerase subunit alpha [Candidatus Falkowbacteria bacterium]|nr:DNA-directed RNA polymerase subunit alpha [Candidatus Falkowbacteria bacterium]
MQKVSLPSKIEVIEDKENKNHGVVTIEPCYPGFGITIGNALRRVLLSSLPGAAAVAFKVKGVQHEFSTLPGVKEDMVEIMVNLKQLNLRLHSEEPVELLLKAKGCKPATGADIVKNSDVEIINPDVVICNLTDKNTELEMKIWVEQGLGYIPVEDRKGEKPEIGVIQLDAVYTPIQKVGINKENVRVGERTDYDKLSLDIETDGTISVKDAVKEAGKILMEQFNFVIDTVSGAKEEVEKEKEDTGEVKEEKVKEDPSISLDKARDRQLGVGKKEEEKEEEVPSEKPKKRGRPKKT